MKVCIIITHPTQFDVPVFKLGAEFIDVIYTDRARMDTIYDPELKKNVNWGKENLTGYKYEVVPKSGYFEWLYNKLKAEKYDLIITGGYYNRYFIFSLIIGRFFAKKNAIRVDSVLYNNTSVLKNIYKYTLYTFLRLFVNYFFVVGTLSRNYLLRYGVQRSKISTYGYISDNDFFAEGLSVPADVKNKLKDDLHIPRSSLILLCISKHSDREAPFDTLRAFQKLQAGNLHLLLVGDGPLHQQLIDTAASLSIKNITFAGYINFTDLPLYYSISHIFIHDSHDEPWGVSVQEAIAAGLPVITSDKVGASYDLIIEGKNGYVFKTGNVQELADKIGLCINLDEQLVMETNNQILKEWNYEKTLQNIISTVNG